MQGWLFLTLSMCLHNQLSSFNSIIVQMSEKRDSSVVDTTSYIVKVNGGFFQQLLRQNLKLVFVLIFESTFFRVLILKATETAQVLLKNGTRDFQNSPPFKRSTCFYVTVSESFKLFQYFETNLLENENIFQKTVVSFFS